MYIPSSQLAPGPIVYDRVRFAATRFANISSLLAANSLRVVAAVAWRSPLHSAMPSQISAMGSSNSTIEASGFETLSGRLNTERLWFFFLVLRTTNTATP